MAACTTPLTSILGTDCIGDSRNVINNNFATLTDDICNVYTTLSALTGVLDNRVVTLSSFVKSLSAKDSSTIDISFNANSYFLSADVINNSLGTNKLGQDITTFGKNLLSSTGIPLSSLVGVQLSSIPSLGEVLKWNGSVWTNQTEAAVLSGLLTDGNKSDITVSNNGLIWSINPDAITNTKILNLAITEGKISTGAVTESKIGTGAVTESKIGTGAVVANKIADGAITENKIGTGAVTVNKIVDGIISNTKLTTAPALSIKGNPNNSTGAIQDIQATANDRVLIRSGNALIFGTVPNGATSANSVNSTNTIVLRNSSGDFSANVISAAAFSGNLSGNATTAGNVTGIVAIANGGTGASTAASARTNLGVVSRDGDTMTGALTLNANPTSNLHAATKQYVDNFNRCTTYSAINREYTELTSVAPAVGSTVTNPIWYTFLQITSIASTAKTFQISGRINYDAVNSNAQTRTNGVLNWFGRLIVNDTYIVDVNGTNAHGGDFSSTNYLLLQGAYTLPPNITISSIKLQLTNPYNANPIINNTHNGDNRFADNNNIYYTSRLDVIAF